MHHTHVREKKMPLLVPASSFLPLGNMYVFNAPSACLVAASSTCHQQPCGRRSDSLDLLLSLVHMSRWLILPKICHANDFFTYPHFIQNANGDERGDAFLLALGSPLDCPLAE